MPFLEAELRPCLTSSNGWVDLLLDDSCADSTCGFDAFAVLIEAVGGDGLGAIFIGGDGLLGKGGGVIELFVICPVGAAVTRKSERERKCRGKGMGILC